MITIAAITPDGKIMHWSGRKWVDNKENAKVFDSIKTAKNTAKFEYPFEGLARLGWRIQVQSGNQAVAYRGNEK